MDGYYVVSVLGPVTVRSGWTMVPVTQARRQMLAALVAAGPNGANWRQLAASGGITKGEPAAVRMSIARLRSQLPDGALPNAKGGRYALTLPPQLVDAWHLAELSGGGALDSAAASQIRQLLAPSSPYSDVEWAPPIDQAVTQVAAQRAALFSRVMERDRSLLGREFAAHVWWLCEEEPFNEQLLFDSVRLLADTGDRQDALRLLRQGSDRLAEIGLSLSQPLQELERDILGGTHQVDERPLAQAELPPRLRDQLDIGFVGGRDKIKVVAQIVERSDPGLTTLVVEGPAGSGKTRLIAELAVDAQRRRWNVVYSAPSRPGADGPLGSLSAAMPTLRNQIDAVLHRSELDHETRQLELWSSVHAELDRLATRSPLLLIADDLHWSDSMQLDFLAHLSTAMSDRTIVLVCAGRDDDESLRHWGPVAEAAERSGARRYRVEPLTVDQMTDLVDGLCPDLEPAMLLRAARRIHRDSAGLPAVAIALVRSSDIADGGRLGEGAPRLDQLLAASLPPAVVSVGAAGAVLGGDFDVGSLAYITDQTTDDVLRSLDVLVRRDLFVEISPTTFHERHSLVTAALLGGVERDVLRLLHARARTLGRSVHDDARHAVGAGPFVDRDDTVAALLLSATEYVSAGLPAEASITFRTIEETLGAAVPHDALPAFTRALDLCGHHDEAMRRRQEAFARDISRSSPDTALDLAVSGLPEAEPIDGSTALLELLASLSSDELSSSHRLRLTRHLGRQLAIAGRPEEAQAVLRSLDPSRLPVPDRIGLTFTTHAVMRGQRSAGERLVLLRAIEQDLAAASADAVAEWLVLAALDHIEEGSLDGAERLVRRLQQLHDAPVLRRWHAQLLEALVLAERDDPEAARSKRNDAFNLGALAGVREAGRAFLIGEFVELVLDGATSTLLDGVDSGQFDPAENAIMRAGVAHILDEAGRSDEAERHAEAVARDPVVAGSTNGLVALALVSRPLSRVADSDLVNDAKQRLASRRDAMLVVGAGAACLGPARRYAAHLEADPEARRELLTSAVAFADSAGFTRWAGAARRDAGFTMM